MKHNPGDRHNRWTLIEHLGGREWIAQCNCGTRKTVGISNLMTGASSSCGCSKREGPRSLWPNEWGVWKGLRQRCGNKGHAEYKNYGGRGIKVCRRWAKSFSNFIADMGPRPDKSLSIDRIDNDGDYSPSNCRWATSKCQINNRRKTIRITAFGETKALTDWMEDARYCGIYETAFRHRIVTGMDPEMAITMKPRQGGRGHRYLRFA